jgi:hypothetical protein
MAQSTTGRKKRIRNLSQFKSLSDEEFDKAYQRLLENRSSSESFEVRILEKMAQFEEDYDTTDMKYNDKETLRALIQALISLEDMEQMAFTIREQAVGDDQAMARLDRITRMMQSTRQDISRMQEDLSITRKIRKGEKEESVLAYIKKLKAKANQYSNAKFGRIYCPTCKTLIGSVWALYPDSKNNKFQFHCKREVVGDDDEVHICDTKVVITYQELLEKGMKNVDGVPDY